MKHFPISAIMVGVFILMLVLDRLSPSKRAASEAVLCYSKIDVAVLQGSQPFL